MIYPADYMFFILSAGEIDLFENLDIIHIRLLVEEVARDVS
jgi:hypothetical protein